MGQPGALFVGPQHIDQRLDPFLGARHHHRPLARFQGLLEQARQGRLEGPVDQVIEGDVGHGTDGRAPGTLFFLVIIGHQAVEQTHPKTGTALRHGRFVRLRPGDPGDVEVGPRGLANEA